MSTLHGLFSLFQRRIQRLPVKVHLIAQKADDIDFQLSYDEGDCACTTTVNRYHPEEVSDKPMDDGWNGKNE